MSSSATSAPKPDATREPEAPPWSASSLGDFAVLAVQLGIILWVIRAYALEGLVFKKLAVLLFFGFSIHYFLPARWRLTFFAALSVTGVLVIFGPVPGAWLLAIGLALVGICHLPIPFWARVAVLVAAVGGLIAVRTGRLPGPVPAAIWPILGSMFALRLIVYLYDLRHRSAPFSLVRSLGYFFMLPNICFPLFPVVDYQTFCRTHEEQRDRRRGYQMGLDWMLRGTIQLILYRVVYQRLPIDTEAVVDVPSLLRYLLWPFLLYLQVSGLFHLVIGMLHLFGFNLPETHHRYYLASSFTDFWRRINIYWKDFMMKVFYYPSYFRLRKRGNAFALVVGTFVVFFATWVLHSWQWFWLRGDVLYKGTDVLFWTILAVLVAVNVLVESRRPMTRRLGSGSVPWSQSVRKAIQAFGVFACICLLWSLWVSDSWAEWSSLFSVVGHAGRGDLKFLALLVGFAVVFVAVAIAVERRPAPPFHFYGRAARNAGIAFLLALLVYPRFYQQFRGGFSLAMERIKTPGLNARDAARRQRDYYEKLNDVGWDNAELSKVYMQKPADWGTIRSRPDLVQFNTGLPHLELRPNAQGRHRGTQVQFNRWGMRDRDYPLAADAGSYRIALVGPSDAFASGVPQEQGFEALVEDRLNREGSLTPYFRVEILNFATEGYTALDVLASLDKKVFGFQPRALVYVVHQVDAHLGVVRLSRLMEQRGDVPYPELLEFARAGGVAPGTPERVGTRDLQPQREALLKWAYGQIVQRCRAQGITPVMVYLPMLTPHDYDVPVPRLLAMGLEAGFFVIDLSTVYDGQDAEKLQLAPWDDHPNVIGHRLIADRLYAAMRGAEESLWRANDQRPDQGPGANVPVEGVSAGGGS